MVNREWAKKWYWPGNMQSIKSPKFLPSHYDTWWKWPKLPYHELIGYILWILLLMAIFLGQSHFKISVFILKNLENSQIIIAVSWNVGSRWAWSIGDYCSRSCHIIGFRSVFVCQSFSGLWPFHMLRYWSWSWRFLQKWKLSKNGKWANCNLLHQIKFIEVLNV